MYVDGHQVYACIPHLLRWAIHASLRWRLWCVFQKTAQLDVVGDIPQPGQEGEAAV